MKNLKNKKMIKVLCLISMVLTLNLAGCGKNENKTEQPKKETSTQQKNQETNKPEESTKKPEVKPESKKINKQSPNAPKFSKQQLDKNSNPEFNTAWKTSNNGDYNACIEGKGTTGSEEGIGKILLKDNSGNISRFEILDNKKISPRNIEWVDNENLLVVVGSSQGTVSKGGNLYMLNITTGNTSTIIETPDKKQQIMSAKKSGNNINLKLTVYDDGNYNESHIENWTIYSFDSSLNKNMEVKNSQGKLIYTINESK